MEEKIIELETKLAFQEQLLAELNDAMTSQQKQLVILQRDYQQLLTRFNDYLENQPVAPQDEPPPPHY